jgi:Tol biopolymer transport system component
VGGQVRKLQDTTGFAAMSPDGSRIVFEKAEDLWQMGPTGEDPKRLPGPSIGTSLQGPVGFAHYANLAWSPDGRWVTYRRLRKAQQGGAGSPGAPDQWGTPVLEARLPETGGVTTILEDPDLRSYVWLSATQIVLDRWGAPDRPFSNLWEIDIDPRTMRALGNPRRLTNWAGFAIEMMSSSPASGRLVITRRLDQSVIFIGELGERGDTLGAPRRLSSEDRTEWPGGWSGDSKSLLFQSDRTGNMNIFRQALDAANAEPVTTNPEDDRAPVFSPDGQWALYFAWPRSAAAIKVGRLMRTPIGGGSPEVILEAKGFPGSAQTSGHVVLTTNTGQPAFRCPSKAGAHCVLSEAESDSVAFREFNPVTSAAKSTMFRITAKDPNRVSWSLSPDGSRIAYSEDELHSATVHIRELGSGLTHDITLSDRAELTTIEWAADGKSLFTTVFAPDGSSILHVTLDGRYQQIHKVAKDVETPRASPDGRRLAFGEVVSGSNVWLIEGFPK